MNKVRALTRGKAAKAQVLVFCLAFLSGCGVGPHDDAPTVKFLNAKADPDTGVTIVSAESVVVETQTQLSTPEDRTVFLEVLSNEEYLQGQRAELIQGEDWGATRFVDRNDTEGAATFELRAGSLGDFELRVGETYWLRSGILLGQRDFGVIVSLIELPIDRRSGHLFDTITVDGSAVRVAYGVSDFIPFKFLGDGESSE